MEKPAKTRKPYTSDLTDAQWELVQPLIPTWKVGRTRQTDMREVLNAVFYVMTSGCAWKNLPNDFPPEGTVRDYFHTWPRELQSRVSWLRTADNRRQGRARD